MKQIKTKYDKSRFDLMLKLGSVSQKIRVSRAPSDWMKHSHEQSRMHVWFWFGKYLLK